MVPVEVIVEPDTLGAYTGLVGVIVGAALGSLGTWLTNRGTDRKVRKAGVDQATTDLIVGANQVAVTVSGFIHANPPPDQYLDWQREIRREMDRVQAATAVLLREAPELRDVANRVQLAVISVAQQSGGDDTFAVLRERIAEMSAVAFPEPKKPRRQRTVNNAPSPTAGIDGA